MNEPRDIFCDVLVRVIEGQATPEDREAFRALLRAHPEFWPLYREQMRLHALLQCASGEGAEGSGQSRQPRVPERRRRGRWWRGAAAAVVLLAVGAAAKFGAERAPLPERRPDPVLDARPIRLVRQVASAGLELPQALPGTVRLASGLAQVRLPSGVELSLAGPLELEAESGMEVRLKRGQVLAWVPKRASGFTAHAPGLTAWDIGTVFSVTAEPRVSRLFVFKGNVQALDGEGEGVGLCEAGQGVLAEAGRPAEVFDSDEENARRLFAKVRGDAALADPEAALAAAGLIADLWVARYAPVVVRRSAGKRPQKEEETMNRSKTMAVLEAAAASEEQSGSGVSGKRAALAALLLTAAPLAQTAAAAGFTWLPQTGSNDWSVAENWTPAGPPGMSNILDTATIPASATGVINYNSSGQTFDTLSVQTVGTTQLTLRVSAPLTLTLQTTKAATFGNGAGTGLYTVVTSGGSFTSLFGKVTSYGRFDVEQGGVAVLNKNSYPDNIAWNMLGASTIRGVVSTGAGLDTKCAVGIGGDMVIDGGSLDADGLAFGAASGLRFTDNGGSVNLRVQGSGLPMYATLYNGTYAVNLTMPAGTLTNEASLIVGGPNTFTHDGATTDGTNYGGVARVTLSGGEFLQKGYTAVGDGRVGIIAVSGTVFRSYSDFYVGGGDYWGYGVPKPNVAVSGIVSIVSGSVTVTNAPAFQSASGFGSNNGALFYFSEGTPLFEGQRIMFTNLSSQVAGLSTGVVYFVKVYRYVNNAKCFNVATLPGGPSVGTYSGSGGTAQWQTFPTVFSVGNAATFKYGTRMPTGTLEVCGGSLTVDQFVATNGTSSVVRFTKGSLNVLLAADITNGVPFVAGNGADAAVLGLAGTARFADGLVVNTNATLAVGGTNAVGAVAVTGDVTLRQGAVLDVDFTAATNDCLTVDGDVTLPENMTLSLRPLDTAYPSLMPVIQVTGAGTLTGTAAGWPKVVLNGVKYKAVVSGSQVLVQKIAQGTMMSVY